MWWGYREKGQLHVHMCAWVIIRVEIQYQLWISFSKAVLRQGLLLDSELTDLGELAGQCGSGIHPICLPSLGGQVHADAPGF